MRSRMAGPLTPLLITKWFFAISPPNDKGISPHEFYHEGFKGRFIILILVSQYQKHQPFWRLEHMQKILLLLYLV